MSAPDTVCSSPLPSCRRSCARVSGSSRRAEPRRRLANPLRDRIHAPALGGVDVQDAVGLAEAQRAQHDRVGLVRACHDLSVGCRDAGRCRPAAGQGRRVRGGRRPDGRGLYGDRRVRSGRAVSGGAARRRRPQRDRRGDRRSRCSTGRSSAPSRSCPGSGRWPSSRPPTSPGCACWRSTPPRRAAASGALLAQACIDRARATGRSRLVLHTTGAMAAAHRLYRGLGFAAHPGARPDDAGRPRARGLCVRARRRGRHSLTARTSASWIASISRSVSTSNTARGVPAAHQTVAKRRSDSSTTVRT